MSNPNYTKQDKYYPYFTVTGIINLQAERLQIDYTIIKDVFLEILTSVHNTIDNKNYYYTPL